ncbi:hypothetical protein LMG26858_05526 [Achromobacter anxifer]|uniref:Uncharacterized protein n=1 Tax=Achromobacter anxifer TaxID=1287737 RepID=A0A6S7EYF4_9BURK|nr:hypothetical protein LMG26858_05526 [Achromobacter anxifer]
MRIAAERHQADAGRAVRHQPPGQGHQRRRRARHGPYHPGPVARRGQRRQHRQEDQRAGGGAGGQQAHHHAAMLAEPAVDDGGAQHHGHRARAQAREHAPGQQQMPGLGHEGAGRAGRGHQCEGADQHAAQAEAFHRGGRERSDHAVQEDADGGRQRDGAATPAEGFFQRHQQHAGRGAQAGRDQQGQEDHRDDDESVLLAGALERDGRAGYTHVTDRYVLGFANSTYRSVT